MRKWIDRSGQVGRSYPTTRVLPSGQIGVDRVLGWVAFGRAVSLEAWDTDFYFGASEWFDWCPDLLAGRLERAANGEILCDLEVGEHLLGHLRAAADETRGKSKRTKLRDGAIPPPKLVKLPALPDLGELSAAAGLLAPHIRANNAIFKAKRDAIVSAAHRLRRALAAGDLVTHGRCCAAVGVADGRRAMCRVRIGPGAFRGAIMVTCEGVRSWTICPSPSPETTTISSCAPLLYQDLLFDAVDVLRIWPDRSPIIKRG